ncbi:hypothetical protein BCV53_12315 [Parageobacillus thermoglucosidasius]|uniref:Uncharacterized protein n=1 Tax=Parageobacillus thermoglucosidasius TaxID=1426 RepID=A0AAN0YT77_PARTM|nr:hypothetical protein AOT13_12305 [Parageobacillus thermoglucosidasius]GAJ44230.1 hypothetical protein GT2_15_01190 [Parageobacillus thermoglucosidasius NBRC 107763]ANZ30813.1 hypothetical protein BCV53_12315 [Parageobacillus thermoglucosidasius]APM81550.1 hypothetical protein BCV54_12325 [Parageobacillus thermoglucosidasius]KJX69383.1 hypothetical protein WH82_07880 [Parageobacillus thermoglucosidasius]
MGLSNHVVTVSTLVAEERRLSPAVCLVLFRGSRLIPIALVRLPLLILCLEIPSFFESFVGTGAGLISLFFGGYMLWTILPERLK